MKRQTPPVKTGLMRLLEAPPSSIAGQRLGLLCNPASVTPDFRHAARLIHDRFPGQLRAIYSPQHGFFAEKQDNMIESGHIRDPFTGLPVFSLYGETRTPTAEMFAPIDLLLVDMQDAGTRVYTFIYTMANCMIAAERLGKAVLVLDRPNPVGGVSVEGNCLKPEYASFVGMYPIPMRYGMTVGELAMLFNDRFGIGCRLKIVPMDGWRREMCFRETGLSWVAPSPNLPTPESAMVYPGQVIWEGTNISEGRGTTQPFEFFGAPFFNLEQIIDAVAKTDRDAQILSGAVLRPIVFEPTSGKWAGCPCRGFQIHVTDPSLFRPYRLSLSLLGIVLRLYPDAFAWKQPPYEYEYERLPIDLILGDRDVRLRLAASESVADIEAGWMGELEDFGKVRENYLIY
jgi:uncharacterized protein YbbC (DUF1343 family)